MSRSFRFTRYVGQSIALALVLTFGCTTHRSLEMSHERSLPLLSATDGRLGWTGLLLGMTRASVENSLQRQLQVRHDSYADICGEYYSSFEVRRRHVRISWSSPTPDGVIEVIAVPYGGAERLSYDDDLSRSAVTALPDLVPEVLEESGDCPPRYSSFLVLRSNSEHALNLKSSGEGVFYVTAVGCVD